MVKSTGIKAPPLLYAALGANMKSVEWFLSSDAPLHHYVKFGHSKAMLNNPGVRQIAMVPGGVSRAVSKWLGIQSRFSRFCYWCPPPLTRSDDLVIHCVVLAPPSEAACKLLEFLISVYPAAIETKNTNGETPLWVACKFLEPEFVKILIDSGADQSARNKLGSNILHAMLLDKPTAKRLRPVLDLIDRELLEHLFSSRNNLSDNGETPLHSWVSANTTPYYYWERKPNEEKDKEATEALKLILEVSGGKGLEMLNGAGDTPLHTAVMQSCEHVVRELLQFRPTLLYRENAVGRTPLEVARDFVTAENFAMPSTIRPPGTENSVGSLVNRASETFVEKKDRDDQKTKPTAKEIVWKICAEVRAGSPGKRRLVSLNEANDVARRLGEKYSPSRYFSIQARDDDEEVDEEAEGERHMDDFAVLTARERLRNRGVTYCPTCGKFH